MTITIIAFLAPIAIIYFASEEADWPVWKKFALGVMLLVVAWVLVISANSAVGLAVYAPYALRSGNADAIMVSQLVADAIILGFLWPVFGWLYRRAGGRKGERERGRAWRRL